MFVLRAVAALFLTFIATGAMAALPELRLTSEIVNEDESPVEISVFVNATEEAPARFRITTADGTAIAGEDYVAVTNKRIETADGTTIRIVILDDDIGEQQETFYLDVTDVENAIAVTKRVSITIQDDSVYPEPRITAASTGEGDQFEKTVEAFITLPVSFPIPYSVHVLSRSITAQARVDYEPVDEVVTFRPGKKSVSVPITIYGDNRHEADETFRLELEGLSSTAVFTIVDDDEPNSLPGVSIDDADVIEGTGAPSFARFRVALTAPSFDGVTVRFETEGRSALTGSDFIRQAGLVQFKPGERVKWIDVEVFGDDHPEYYWEFFDVTLLEADGANLEHFTAFGRIRDDDTNDVRWLKVHDAVALEGTTAVFRLELSRPSTVPIEVRWAVAESLVDAWLPGPRARTPGDFVQRISKITFAPGETLKEIPVPLLADSAVEGDEYFGLFIAPGAAGIEYDPRPGTGIIIDDDRDFEWPQLRVEDRMTVEGDTWTAVALALTLSRATEIPASVVVATREPGGLDFEETSVTVTFEPGETEKSVVLRVRGDDVAEPLKVFNVDFRDPSGLTIARDSVAITVIDDDRAPRDRAVRH